MSTIWSDAEIHELVRLWPVASSQQIAQWLRRPRAAISSKARRLRCDGVLPPHVAKQYDVIPWPARSPLRQTPHLKSAPAKAPGIAPVVSRIDDPLDMRPCTLIELDEHRCHWPLGDVEMIATEYCGGDALPGRRYCAHHCRRASKA